MKFPAIKHRLMSKTTILINGIGLLLISITVLLLIMNISAGLFSFIVIGILVMFQLRIIRNRKILNTETEYLKEITEKSRIIQLQKDELFVLNQEYFKMNKQLLEERSISIKGNALVFKFQNSEGWPVTYVSSNRENIFGYAKEDFTKAKIKYSDIIHKDDIQRLKKELDEANGGNSSSFELEEYRIRGSRRKTTGFQ